MSRDPETKRRVDGRRARGEYGSLSTGKGPSNIRRPDPADGWQGIKAHDEDGATIYLEPNSTYLIESHPVTLTANDLSIVGPPSATIKVADGVVGSNGNTGQIEFSGSDGYIRGWTFDGNITGQAADDVYGLKWDLSATGWTVENQRNINACGDAYLVRDDHTIRSVRCTGFGEQAFDIQSENGGWLIEDAYAKGPVPIAFKTRTDIAGIEGGTVRDSRIVATDGTVAMTVSVTDPSYYVRNVQFENVEFIGDDINADDCVRFAGDGNGIVEDIIFDGCLVKGRQGIHTANSPTKTHNITVRDTVIESSGSSRELVVHNGEDWTIDNCPFKTTNNIVLGSDTTDVKFYGHYYDRATFEDSGVRVTFNGLGVNAGNPASTGDWNGNGYEGVAVQDTVNGVTYDFVNGSWTDT